MIRFPGVYQQSGPPDLEETINRFLNKIRRRKASLDAFRRNGGGDSGGDQRPDLPKFAISLVVVVISFVVLIAVFLSGFYTVDQSERAVTFRFGKPIGVSQPGLRWILPYIEDYQLVNLTGVRTVEIGYRGSQKSKVARESLMLTDNLNIIDLQFAVQYLLKDPEDFLYNNRDPEAAVQQVAETAMREVVGRSDIDFVLYQGREQIALDTLALMQEILDRYSTGILIQQVAIQNVQPPDQVQDAFEDAIRARQDRERKINEGEAYANDIVPKARGLSARILEDAEAYRQQRIALADGRSQRFSQLAVEYDDAPVVTRQRLYLDAIEDLMSKTNKIIVDQKEGSNSLLYLPLDRIIRGGESRTGQDSLLDPRDSISDLLSRGANAANNTSEEFRDEVRRRREALNQ